MRMIEKDRKRENEIDPEWDNFRLTSGIVRVKIENMIKWATERVSKWDRQIEEEE